MRERAEMTTKSRVTVGLLAFLISSSGCIQLVSVASESYNIGPILLVLLFFVSVQSTTHVQVQGGVAGGAGSEGDPSSTAPSTTQLTQSEVATGSSTSSATTTSYLVAAIPGFWSDHSRKRSRFEVYVEILELLKRGPLTPFEIAFYARLNHKRAKEYIGFLERSGYLDLIGEGGRTVCVLSTSGTDIVERARAVYGLFGNDFITRNAER